MPESACHAKLVKIILQYAEYALGCLQELMVQEDAIQPLRGERPPNISGHIPDVFVTDVPTTMTLIGEAKTPQDLHTDRSLRQMESFLDYLSIEPSGIFVLAVPLVAVANARNILFNLSQPFAAANTQIIVLDNSGKVW